MTKKHRKNRKHLNWIHEFECIVKHDCFGGLQAHHLMRPFIGDRGMGMKSSDENVIPLCWKHHNELHAITEVKFFLKYFDDEDYGKEQALKFWLMSPFRK